MKKLRRKQPSSPGSILTSKPSCIQRRHKEHDAMPNITQNEGPRKLSSLKHSKSPLKLPTKTAKPQHDRLIPRKTVPDNQGQTETNSTGSLGASLRRPKLRVGDHRDLHVASGFFSPPWLCVFFEYFCHFLSLFVLLKFGVFSLFQCFYFFSDLAVTW